MDILQPLWKGGLHPSLLKVGSSLSFTGHSGAAQQSQTLNALSLSLSHTDLHSRSHTVINMHGSHHCVAVNQPVEAIAPLPTGAGLKF